MALEKASRFYAALGILLCVTVVHAGTGIQLQKVGTDAAYFTHNGQPLLSFGGMSDWVFYLNEDAHDYWQWADWAAAHGMNHARAYPPLSYKMIEYVTAENGGAVANALFPYEETSPGSRQFDLTRFDAAYWTQFRNQLLYFQSKGIIVHLLMWNGWQLRAPDTTSGWKGEVNWPGHFFNPANNVNAGTDHLGGDIGNRYRLYHAVSENRTALLNAQKAYFRKLIDETYDLDNVYYDLVHEMAEHYTDWTKTKRWIEAIALDKRQILPISSLQNGCYDIRDVCLSVPTEVGRCGVVATHAIDLWPKEVQGIRKSGQVLRETIDTVQKRLAAPAR